MLPAVVLQVAHQAVRDTSGVVTARYTRRFDVHAGPFNRNDRMVFTAVYDNGNLVLVRIATDEIGGKDATAKQRAQTTSQYEYPPPDTLFRAPWDVRYLADYSYRVVDSTTIAFSSLRADTAHGNGTFVIDSGEHVLSYRYTMSANWQHVTLGTVTGERAEVLPGCWAVEHEVQRYTGRYGIFRGGATTGIVQSSFHRYTTLTGARLAIESR